MQRFTIVYSHTRSTKFQIKDFENFNLIKNVSERLTFELFA